VSNKLSRCFRKIKLPVAYTLIIRPNDSGGSKQKNCAHFEESMKLGMDKPWYILNKFRGGHKWNMQISGRGIILFKMAAMVSVKTLFVSNVVYYV